MYKLIRRISSSFFPRPDRPWSEDATSTAPQIGRKRRLSTEEHEERETTPSMKKHRAAPEDEREPSPAHPAKETEEVKEVTKGVREVELEDGKAPASQQITKGEAEAETPTQEAAAVPLPESPELKPTEGEEDAEGEAASDAEETTEAPGPAPAKEEAPITAAPQESPVKDAPAPSIEEDVPGLTLPTHSEEKAPSTAVASDIPTTHTFADTTPTTSEEGVAGQ